MYPKLSRYIVSLGAALGLLLLVAHAQARPRPAVQLPELVGRIDFTDPVRRLQARGGYLFAALCGSEIPYMYYGSLEIVSIANPALPVVAGTYPDGCHVDVALDGDYAYLADASRVGPMHIVNVADPRAPYRVATSAEHPYGGFTSVAAAGSYTYAAAYSEIMLFDVSDPAAPAYLAGYPISPQVWALTIAGDAVYAATTSGLHVFALGSIDQSALFGAGHFYDVAVAGNHAYAAGYDALYILDVSNPAAPVEISAQVLPDAQARAVAVVGRYAYVSTAAYVNDTAIRGVHILDVSDPAAPLEIGFYDIGTYVSDIAIAGPNVYVADESGILILPLLGFDHSLYLPAVAYTPPP